MSREALRFTLLTCCLTAAVLDTLVVGQLTLRLLLEVLLLGAAVLALRATREPRTDETSVTSSSSEDQSKPSTREFFKRRPSLRQEVETLRQVTAELEAKLAHHDGLRRAMWTTFDGRITEVEAVQQRELAVLRESRERHQVNVDRLQERVETHKSALAALTHVLDEPEPMGAALSEPGPAAQAGVEDAASSHVNAASSF